MICLVAIDVTPPRDARWVRAVVAALAIGLLGGCGGPPLNTPLGECRGLKTFRPPECALPRVLETLSDRNASNMELAYASGAIFASEEKSPEVLARLKALLREELNVQPPAMPRGPEARPRAVYVIHAIDGFGTSASAARAELREAYRSPSSWVAWAGFWALAHLADNEALPGLISLLSSHQIGIYRWEMIDVLPKYGPRAKAAIPVLIPLLEQGYPDAAGLLGLIGDPAAIDPLAQSLRIENYWLRATALEALAGFGPAAASTVPAIESMRDNWAPVVRARAWEALHAIDGREAPAPTPRQPPPCLRTLPTECATQSGTVRLMQVHPSLPQECAQVAKAAGSALGVLFGPSCVLSVNYGEWGTWLIDADRSSGRTRKFPGDAAQFVTLRGQLLAIGPEIETIDRAVDGSLKLEPLAFGPAELIAYGLDAEGDLVLVSNGNGALERSAPKWPRQWAPGHRARDRDVDYPFVLRLDRAGQLVEVH
jgi:hypothetical protein